jgi:hypothetical protein
MIHGFFGMTGLLDRPETRSARPRRVALRSVRAKDGRSISAALDEGEGRAQARPGGSGHRGLLPPEAILDAAERLLKPADCRGRDA